MLFPYRRTKCCTKGGWPCDQIKGSEGDAGGDNVGRFGHDQGLSVGPSGVLRDVLLDVPHPVLSRGEPPFLLAEERPVPRNMKNSQDVVRKFGFTLGCSKCRKLSRNEYSYPCLAHSQDCRTRIEAASRTDLVYRVRAERAEQRQMERIDHSKRSSLERSVVPGPTTGDTDILCGDPECEDHSSVRDVKRARGEPEQDLSGEIPVPIADETLTPPEIPAVPSGARAESFGVLAARFR